MRRIRSSTTQHKQVLASGIIGLVLLGLSTLTHSQSLLVTQSSTSNSVIRNSVFTTQGYYNPLRGSHSQVFIHYSEQVSSMSNEQLSLAAQFHYSPQPSMQRLLNYEWLKDQRQGAKVRLNYRILGPILRMGLRSYWQKMKNSKYQDNVSVPDGHGNIHVSNLAFRMRLTSREQTLKMAYVF